MHVSVIDNPDGTVVVTVRGDLDVDSGGALSTSLDQALLAPLPRIVVDLSGVGFCDSTGLRAFVTAHHRAVAAGGWLRLAAPDARLGRLLETVGSSHRPPVYDGVVDALSAR